MVNGPMSASSAASSVSVEPQNPLSEQATKSLPSSVAPSTTSPMSLSEQPQARKQEHLADEDDLRLSPLHSGSVADEIERDLSSGSVSSSPVSVSQPGMTTSTTTTTTTRTSTSAPLNTVALVPSALVASATVAKESALGTGEDAFASLDMPLHSLTAPLDQVDVETVVRDEHSFLPAPMPTRVPGMLAIGQAHPQHSSSNDALYSLPQLPATLDVTPMDQQDDHEVGHQDEHQDAVENMEEDEEEESDLSEDDIGSENEDEQLYCICRRRDDGSFMICCDECDEWYHGVCMNLPEDVGRTLPSYTCPRCLGEPFVSLPDTRERRTKADENETSSRSSRNSTAAKRKSTKEKTTSAKSNKKARTDSSRKTTKSLAAHSTKSDTKWKGYQPPPSKDLERTKREQMMKLVRERALSALDSGLFPNEQQKASVLAWLRTEAGAQTVRTLASTPAASSAASTDKDEQQLRALASLRANEIEAALAEIYPTCDREYKSQFRSMLFNLKDDRNPKLRVRVLTLQLPAVDLCRMTSTQMASDEMVEFRKEVQAKAVENAVLQKEDVDFIVKKTHKGEELVQQPHVTGAGAGTTTTEAWMATHTPSRPVTNQASQLGAESQSPHSRASVSDETPTSADPMDQSPDSALARSSAAHSTAVGAADRASSPLAHSPVSLGSSHEHPASPSAKPAAAPLTEADRERLADEEALARLRVQSFDAFSGEPGSSDEEEDAPSLQEPLDGPALDGLKPDLLGDDDDDHAEEDVSDTFGAILWEGSFAKSTTPTFDVSARMLFGDMLSAAMLPSEFKVIGRLAESKLLAYVEKLRKSTRSVLSVLCLQPNSETDSYNYTLLLQYFRERQRCAVLDTDGQGLKELFVMPVSGTDPMPSFLEENDITETQFERIARLSADEDESEELENSAQRPDRLLALLVSQRSAALPRAPSSSAASASSSASTRSSKRSSSSSSRSVSSERPTSDAARFTEDDGPRTPPGTPPPLPAAITSNPLAGISLAQLQSLQSLLGGSAPLLGDSSATSDATAAAHSAAYSPALPATTASASSSAAGATKPATASGWDQPPPAHHLLSPPSTLGSGWDQQQAVNLASVRLPESLGGHLLHAQQPPYLMPHAEPQSHAVHSARMRGGMPRTRGGGVSAGLGAPQHHPHAAPHEPSFSHAEHPHRQQQHHMSALGEQSQSSLNPPASSSVEPPKELGVFWAPPSAGAGAGSRGNYRGRGGRGNFRGRGQGRGGGSFRGRGGEGSPPRTGGNAYEPFGAGDPPPPPPPPLDEHERMMGQAAAAQYQQHSGGFASFGAAREQFSPNGDPGGAASFDGYPGHHPSDAGFAPGARSRGQGQGHGPGRGGRRSRGGRGGGYDGPMRGEGGCGGFEGDHGRGFEQQHHRGQGGGGRGGFGPRDRGDFGGGPSDADRFSPHAAHGAGADTRFDHSRGGGGPADNYAGSSGAGGYPHQQSFQGSPSRGGFPPQQDHYGGGDPQGFHGRPGFERDFDGPERRNYGRGGGRGSRGGGRGGGGRGGGRGGFDGGEWRS